MSIKLPEIEYNVNLSYNQTLHLWIKQNTPSFVSPSIFTGKFLLAPVGFKVTFNLFNTVS
jgi:hypothetical protein